MEPFVLPIVDFRLLIENRQSAIENWQLSYGPSFLSRDDGFLFCANFELARERRRKGSRGCWIQM